MDCVLDTTVVEELLREIVNSLQAKRYHDAYTQATSFQSLAKLCVVNEEVTSFLTDVVSGIEKAKLQEPYVPDTTECLPEKPKDCPQWVPTKRSYRSKCCVDIPSELNCINASNTGLYNKLPQGVRDEFSLRFAVSSKTASLQQDMLNMMVKGSGFPNSILIVLDKHIQGQAQELIKQLQNNDQAHISVGMSSELYKALLEEKKTVEAFVDWYLVHDWTYWWFGIVFYRLVTNLIGAWSSWTGFPNLLMVYSRVYLGEEINEMGAIVVTSNLVFLMLLKILTQFKTLNFVFSALKSPMANMFSFAMMRYRWLKLLYSGSTMYEMSRIAMNYITEPSSYPKYQVCFVQSVSIPVKDVFARLLYVSSRLIWTHLLPGTKTELEKFVRNSIDVIYGNQINLTKWDEELNKNLENPQYWTRQKEDDIGPLIPMAKTVNLNDEQYNQFIDQLNYPIHLDAPVVALSYKQAENSYGKPNQTFDSYMQFARAF